MSEIISEAFKKAEATAKAKKAENDIHLLPKPVMTFLLVYSAQGVIDNGGYAYFFGSDWPDKLPYEYFYEAYNEIGCTNQAKDIQRVISTFPFTDPHLKMDERKKYIKENYYDEAFEVIGWGDALCGDEEVWEKLSSYYKIHENDFA